VLANNYCSAEQQLQQHDQEANSDSSIMSAAHVFQVISIVVAIASLSWAVFVTLRKGDIKRPALKVTIGLTGISANFIAQGESKTRRIERSTLILTAKLQKNETGFFPIFLCVRNAGKTALRNVQVQLTYPAEHYLRDVSQVLHFKFADKRKITLGSAEHRNGMTFEGTAYVVHEFELVRPGEGLILTEIGVWRVSPAAEVAVELETLPLAQRLQRAGVSGYFSIDVFVAAENCPPTAKRFNVLWINDEFKPQDETAVNDAIGRITKGFWGRMPSPGIYFKPWWPGRKPIVSWEGAEILLLDLFSATHAGKRFQIAEHEPLGYGLAKIPMPTWNYHDEPRPNIEALRFPLLSRIAGWRPFSTRSGK
jgi:hypothetical protein